jgi:hypothetical protein
VKALLCGDCGDVQALQMEWRTCSCGLLSARWRGGSRASAMMGLADFWTRHEHDRRHGFVLGLHNGVLEPALRGKLGMFQDFRAAHDAATTAPGYVFDKERAGCWAVPFAVGRTNDVAWCDLGPDDRPTWVIEAELEFQEARARRPEAPSETAKNPSAGAGTGN